MLYALGVVVLGALFAPPLFWAVQAAGNQFHSSWLLAQPFRRVFNRAMLIVALAGLWPLLRNLGFRSWRDVGFRRSAGGWRNALIGFALGAGSIAIAVGVSCALGHRSVEIDRSAGELGVAVLRYLLTGLIVAVIEETFFRGAIQNALQRDLRPVTAILITSTVYSAVHFLKPKGVNIPADAVNWGSGFACLGKIVTGSLLERDVAIGFVTLLLAGITVGWAFYKTGTLHLPIGLHAGWVLVNEFARWLNAGKIIEDVVAWPAVMVVLAVVVWLCRNNRN